MLRYDRCVATDGQLTHQSRSGGRTPYFGGGGGVLLPLYRASRPLLKNGTRFVTRANDLGAIGGREEEAPTTPATAADGPLQSSVPGTKEEPLMVPPPRE